MTDPKLHLPSGPVPSKEELVELLRTAAEHGTHVVVPETAVVSMGPLTTREACQVHKEHSPRSHINHRHHIWPLGEGGPDTPRNRVIVCPTGHSNIHALLDLYRRNSGQPPSEAMRRFTHQERVFARTGWECMVRGSM